MGRASTKKQISTREEGNDEPQKSYNRPNLLAFIMSGGD